MGNVARFHTREMLSQVAEVARKFGWKGKCVMPERVVDELVFWRKNLRDLNGLNMRDSEDVVFARRDV